MIDLQSITHFRPFVNEVVGLTADLILRVDEGVASAASDAFIEIHPSITKDYHYCQLTQPN